MEYAVITKQMAKNSEYPPGALVRRVVEGSAAEEAGIKANDVITQIDETQLNGGTSLAREILKHQPGEKVQLTIWRDSQTLTVAATLQVAE